MSTDAVDDRELFLAMAVHELRGPATVMIGAAEILERFAQRDIASDETQKLVALIAHSGRRMQRLVADLLTSAYIEQGSVRIDASLVAVLPILQWGVAASTASNGDVITECDPALQVWAEADRLEQIVDNLVRNALEHGGTPVVVSATDGDGAVRIVVRDHGRGIPTEDSPHLFDRFSHVAARRSTSIGLGLSISRGLARAMGGDLVCVPAHPGARFELTLLGSEPRSSKE